MSSTKLQDATPSTPRPTLLTLAPELRTQIYTYLIPSSLLSPHSLAHDSEWSLATPDPSIVRQPPAFIYAHSKIYSEATPLFYTLATLEVAPPRQSNNWFNVRLGGTGTGTGTKVISHAYARLQTTFRAYNPDHLRLIRRTHIYSNQSDVVDGECYEALLQWLVEHTGVEKVRVSSRPMTRIRGTAGFDLSAWRALFVEDLAVDLRVVRVWATAERPMWDHEKMTRLYCSSGSGGGLVPAQIYFFSDASAPASAMQLQLDPRWLTKRNGEVEEKEMTDEAAVLIDALMERLLQGRELVDYRAHRRHWHSCEKSWVYQMIVIAKTRDV